MRGRRARHAMVMVAAAALALTLGAAPPASALPGRTTRVGRRSEAPAEDGIVRAGAKPIDPGSAPEVQSPLSLQSTDAHGAVAHTPRVYLVFWGSQWSSDSAGAAPALQAFFQGLHGNVDTYSNLLLQYCSGLAAGTVNCGSAGDHVQKPMTSVLAGTWFDNGSAAPTNATGTQIANEAAAAAVHFGNTTAASNFETQYVIASAHGTHPDGFPGSGFCAWHSSTTRASGGTIAYTNLPYIPDLGAGGCTTISSPTLLDGYFSTETHEYAESVTDLWPGAGWLDSGGEENADKCVDLDARLTLPTGTFDVQGLWSNVDSACLTATSAPASAAVRPDAAIRRVGGSNIGNDVYNTTGANQTVSVAAARGTVVAFKITLQNDGTAADTLTVTGQPSTPSYTVRYLDAGVDVTSSVLAGTYSTGVLASGAAHLLTAKVTVGAGAAAGSSVSRLVTVRSATNVNKADTVKAVVHRS